MPSTPRSRTPSSRSEGSSRSTGATAKAANEPRNIGDHAHQLVHDALASGTLAGKDVKAAVRRATLDLKDAITKALPADRTHLLHQAFDGMASAVAASAASAETGWRKAKASGRRISKVEVRSFVDSMRSLEADFLEAVSEAAQGLKGESEATLQDLARRARAAGTRIGPAARSAMNVAASHGPELVVETAMAGGRAAAGVAGQFALGVSGILSGLGSALRDAGKAAPAPRSVVVTSGGSKKKSTAAKQTGAAHKASKAKAKIGGARKSSPRAKRG